MTDKNKQREKMKMSYCLMVMMMAGMAAPLRSCFDLFGLKSAGNNLGSEVRSAGNDVVDRGTSAARQVATEFVTHAGSEARSVVDYSRQVLGQETRDVVDHAASTTERVGQGLIQGVDKVVGNMLQGVSDDVVFGSRALRAGAKALNKTLEEELIRDGKRVPPRARKTL